MCSCGWWSMGRGATAGARRSRPAGAAAPRRDAARPRLLCRLHHDLIDIAPQPVLARLERLHKRVAGGMEMLGGMLVLRRVTAADVPADEALAQMDPGISRFQAVLASVRARRHIMDFVQVRAGCRRHYLSPLVTQAH